jgi:hypothetical protein
LRVEQTNKRTPNKTCLRSKIVTASVYLLFNLRYAINSKIQTVTRKSKSKKIINKEAEGALNYTGLSPFCFLIILANQ